MGRPSRPCGVCEVSASKYKCPSCLLPYCSLACCKKHKEVPCKQASPPEEKTVPLAHPKTSCQVDEESWVLKMEELKCLVDSSEIQGFLKNAELRNLIRTIDCAGDPEDELEKAMGTQLFREFADKILAVVRPAE